MVVPKAGLYKALPLYYSFKHLVGMILGGTILSINTLPWFSILSYIFRRKVLIDGFELKKNRCDLQWQSEDPNPASGTDASLRLKSMLAQ